MALSAGFQRDCIVIVHSVVPVLAHPWQGGKPDFLSPYLNILQRMGHFTDFDAVSLEMTLA